MQDDLFGYRVTTQSAALADWNALILGFLAHAARAPGHLGAALEADPDFAMAHATKGLFYLMLGRREPIETAREARSAALAAAARTRPTPREMHYVEALAAWLDGHPSRTVAEMEAVLADHPRDALAAKISHGVRFILGDIPGMRRSIEAVIPALDQDHPAHGYMLGCHAFALEETGDYARAQDTGRAALARQPDDAWGLHAVAHVFDMTGDSTGGLAWLNGREDAWSHCNNFRYHVWWHKALMHLDQGDIDTVLALYDAEIRKDRTDDYRDISNATSLLSRLELDGINVGNRWEELADLAQDRTEDGCLIFADLHYLLALIGGNRDQAIGRMLGRIRADADTLRGEMQTRMAMPGLSAAEGLAAFGDGNYRGAFVHLARARQSMQLAGGSHAQRDVFERLTIDAAIRGGFLAEARDILTERTSRRAGREDGFAAARMDLIARSGTGWDTAAQARFPAE